MLITEAELERCTATNNDLLICEGGEAGRAAVWNYGTDVCFQNHIHRARFYGGINPYLFYRYFEKLNATGEIDQYRKGVGISNMSSKELASIIFPLPPIREQPRIVATVDQLMERCDELEKLRAAREQKRRIVHKTALQQLLQASTHDTFDIAWQFMNQHFREFYSSPEDIAELGQAIVQLGMEGKLVPHDPYDLPATQLLKEAETRDNRLMRAGGAPLRKSLPKIKQEEEP